MTNPVSKWRGETIRRENPLCSATQLIVQTCSPSTNDCIVSWPWWQRMTHCCRSLRSKDTKRRRWRSWGNGFHPIQDGRDITICKIIIFTTLVLLYDRLVDETAPRLVQLEKGGEKVNSALFLPNVTRFLLRSFVGLLDLHTGNVP